MTHAPNFGLVNIMNKYLSIAGNYLSTFNAVINYLKNDRLCAIYVIGNR